VEAKVDLLLAEVTKLRLAPEPRTSFPVPTVSELDQAEVRELYSSIEALMQPTPAEHWASSSGTGRCPHEGAS
jgi:hypothetical protein